MTKGESLETQLNFKSEQFERPEIVDNILESLKELEPKMESYYTDFHEHPELGGREFRTASKIKQCLEEMGIKILGDKIGIGIGEQGERKEGTGIVAMIEGKSDGPTVALRADMDALPITEDKNHEPRSQNEGVMHACGHDAHIAGLLGATEILKGLADQDKLDGNIVLIFQPSEEKSFQKQSGAVQIVKFLEKTGLRNKIGAFLGLHVFREADRNMINVKEGVQMASSGEVDIILRGPGGHIMNAYELPNLNEITSAMTVELSKIFKPMAKEKKALVASGHTQFDKKTYNVLAGETKSTWVIRITDPNYKDISKDITSQIQDVIQSVITKHLEDRQGNVEVEINKRPGYRPVTHRDQKLVLLAEQAAKETIPNCENKSEISMGGEDMSFYFETLRQKQIPGVFMMVGAANPDKGYPKGPHHSLDFKIDPKVIKDLAAIHSIFSVKAIEYLKDKK